MATAQVTARIDRPIDEVFGYLSRPDRHPLWQEDLDLDGIVTGDGGVGSLGRETRRMMGRTVVTEYEVTEYVEPTRWGFRSVRGPVPMSGVLSCARSGAGTEVTAELTFSGWSGEVMARFVRRRFAEHFQTLKDLLEREDSDGERKGVDGVGADG